MEPTTPGPYESPMRAQCEAELAKDARWNAELRAQVRPEVHKEDADLLLNNKKHVMAAYGVIWGLTVLFVLLLWMRQQKLKKEMVRLEQELGQAVKGGA